MVGKKKVISDTFKRDECFKIVECKNVLFRLEKEIYYEKQSITFGLSRL